jgi:hypothetical protein
MLNELLNKAWTDPFALKGNFARENAYEVAMAASLGLITTRLTDDTFGGRWCVTQRGLNHIHAVTESRGHSVSLRKPPAHGRRSKRS